MTSISSKKIGAWDLGSDRSRGHYTEHRKYGKRDGEAKMNSIHFTYLDRNIRKCSVRPLFKLDVHRSAEITGIISLRRGKVNVFYKV